MISREKEILRVLANDVRMLSADQVARTWWTDTRWGSCRCKESLWDLAVRKWISMQPVLARPIHLLVTPLLTWQAGQPLPQFELLARQLHKRAKSQPAVITVVYATSKTVSLFGKGKKPSIKIAQMTHDLHVSEIFLHLRASGRYSARWLSEDQLPKAWPLDIRPDAVLLDDVGKPATAIEYGGDYSVQRLKELHAGFDSIGLGYELW